MDGSRYAAVQAAITSTTPAIERINAEVWTAAELSSQEVVSAAVHLRELEAAGFTIVSRDTSGRPNAFVAEWQHGAAGPRVGFLPEYDALPGLGNAAVPRPEPAPTGNLAGHGCGHNLLGAACTGAALALKAVMEAGAIDGLIRVYGCAAEETTGAKVWMARDGLFDDLDACLAWHPGPVAMTALARTAAFNDLSVEFSGRTAHAGLEPWRGRSALDALELFCHGINLMREHVEPTARMHYVIRAGGEAVNVVPDYAALSLIIRDTDRGRVEQTTQWARELAAGAAMGTQTTATVRVNFGAYDLLPNAALTERLDHHLQAVGVPAWTPAEQAFARECQRNFDVAEAGMSTTAMPMQPAMTVGGSSDVADVSWNTPFTWFIYPTMPVGIGIHTWPVTACGGMSIGVQAAMGAATILARLGLDVVTDPALRDAARAEFAAHRATTPYVSPLGPASAVAAGPADAADAAGSMPPKTAAEDDFVPATALSR